MEPKTYRTILALFALLAVVAFTSLAQPEPQRESADKRAPNQDYKKGQDTLSQGQSMMEVSRIRNEPHYVMAKAHLQNVGTFARALRDQAQDSGQLSADFARAVVAEITRNLEKAEDHYDEHMKTISADMRSKMTARMKEVSTHRVKLNAAVSTLEKDVQTYTLSSKQIAADSAAILKHLDDLSKMDGEN